MPKNKLRVYIHFVWATWDRHPLITDAFRRALYRHIEGVCVRMGCGVIAIGGAADHVHLLVKLASTVAMADLMEATKGSSSRLVGSELAPGEWFRWQGSYGAFSVSARDLKRVQEYVLDQERRHADGATWTHAEETEECLDADTPAASA